MEGDMTPEQEAEARETMKRIQAEYDARDKANFWLKRPMLAAIRDALEAKPFVRFVISLPGCPLPVTDPKGVELNIDGDGQLMRINAELGYRYIVNVRAVMHIVVDPEKP
jgi:hypothetical protein